MNHFRAREHILVNRMKVLMMADQAGPGKGGAQTQRTDYNWMAGKWSPCSSNCGMGYRNRTVTCEKVSSDQYLVVPDQVCLKLIKLIGKRPEDKQRCGSNACPRWQAGLWETKVRRHQASNCPQVFTGIESLQCSIYRCHEKGFSRQHRSIKCVVSSQASGNDTITNTTVHGSNCRHLPRPASWKRCPLNSCQPQWITGPWSQVNKGGWIALKSRTV